MKLSKQQEEAAAIIAKSDDPVVLIEGYAGTGKTHLLKELVQGSSTPVLTPTNKAAQVLRERGIEQAQTLHSYMYSPIERPVYATNEFGEIEYDEKGEPIVVDYEVTFGAKQANGDKAPLAYFDEGSMITDKIVDDALDFFEQIVIFRDPFQLPPVKGSMAMDGCRPHKFLDEVHRAAWDSPITRLATKIRRGEAEEYEGIEVVGRAPIALLAGEQWRSIAWKNTKRRSLNAAYRKELDLGRAPKVGEEVVCLENIRMGGALEFFNGEILPIKSIEGCLAEFEEKRMKVRFQPFWMPYWKPEGSKYAGGDFPFDFAYCLTAHKSQGSEWEKVAVFDDRRLMTKAMEPQRWMYTAVTRAKGRLMIVRGE